MLDSSSTAAASVQTGETVVNKTLSWFAPICAGSAMFGQHPTVSGGMVHSGDAHRAAKPAHYCAVCG